jgi:lipoate-protein ligase A
LTRERRRAAGGWQVRTDEGSVGQLLGAGGAAALTGPDGPAVRLVRVAHPTGWSLVLGSTQPESVVDRQEAEARDIDVVRRPSGGGAVLVGPTSVLWVDLVIPAADQLWEQDIRRAAWRVGQIWSAAFETAGLGPVEVWTGGMVRRPWSDRLCFAGLGPGEVVAGGRKVVGISQRRTRHAALFQTAVPLDWQPGASVDLVSGGLHLTAGERAAAVATVEGRVGRVEPGAAGGLLSALRQVLMA